MKLSGADVLKVVFGVLLGWAYTELAHYVIPFDYRVPALIVAYLLIFLMIFFMVKPARPYALSRWLSLWLTLLAAIIILVEDIAIKGVPVGRLVRGVPTILGTTLIAPFVIGWVYGLLRKK